MNIYYVTDSYPEKRCIINKEKHLNYIFFNRKKDIKYFIYLVKKRIFKLNFNWNKESIYKINKRLNGIVHTFNTICDTENLWCTTFESTMPRNNYTCKREWEYNNKFLQDEHTIKALKYMAKDNCLACIALSNSAMKIQLNMLDMINNRYISKKEIENIIKKTMVIHPPQNTLVEYDEIKNKFNSYKKIEFIFIGRDFFRKGGKEVLEVLYELSKRYNFKLTIISTLNYGDYATESNKSDYDECKRIIDTQPWIDYYSSLSNEEVINKCKVAHIGLLPTFADTYGYSLLEMQACGCACVSTNIRALPEINDEKCGWICNIPKDEIGGECMYREEYARLRMKKILKEELKTIFIDILTSDREKLKEKAILSYERIKKEHDPIRYSEELKKIYMKVHTIE